MKLIIGLGNPGSRYKNTKHNAGFWVVDRLAQDNQLEVNKNKFNACWCRGDVGGRQLLLIKPQTYMNLSGTAVSSFVQYFKIVPADDLLVLVDDVSLPVGEIRIREKGSAGGHNGLASIITALGTQEFCRLRLGIFSEGKESDKELAAYVLSGFAKKQDRELIKKTVDLAAEAALAWLEHGAVFAMNKYNKKRR